MPYRPGDDLPFRDEAPPASAGPGATAMVPLGQAPQAGTSPPVVEVSGTCELCRQDLDTLVDHGEYADLLAQIQDPEGDGCARMPCPACEQNGADGVMVIAPPDPVVVST